MPRTNAKGQLSGLVDCNRFSISCEQVFRPDLRGRPVVVLSNYDGCITARSAGAENVAVFSSDPALYDDLSARVMAPMEEICPAIKQYSADEAFMPMPGALAVNAEKIAGTLNETVYRWICIPCPWALHRPEHLPGSPTLQPEKIPTCAYCVPKRRSRRS